jgi:WD40 repeat protein
MVFMLARALQPRLAEQARFTSTKGRMWSAAFSPDGRQIVTTDDQSAQVWDAASRRLLFRLSHDDTVYQAVYSTDGARLVTAGGDGTVRIWCAGGKPA